MVFLLRSGVAIVLVFLLSGRVLAQDSLPAKWGLQDCLDYAIQHNIQLNSLRLSRLSSGQDVLQSQAARLPDLNGSASQNLSGGKVVRSANSTPYIVGSSGNYSLNSNLVIFQGGMLNYDIKQKNLAVQVADLDIAQQVNNITLQITQAFLNILLAKENIVYVKDVVATSEAQVQQGQQRYDAGSIALKDLAQLQSQLANDQYTLVAAENQHRQNKLVLKQLLQLPYTYSMEVSEPDTITTTETPYPLREAQDVALTSRPEIKSSELGIEIAGLNLAKAKAAYLPTLSAGGSIGSSYARDPDFAYLKQLDNNFYQQIGLTLSVPIFTRRVNKTNVEKSKIEVDQSKLVLQDTKTNLSQAVEQEYINVQNAQAQYDAAVVQLKYAQESYRIAAEQQKVGVANMVEFLQQKNLYIQAFQAYIQAKYTAALTIRIYDFYRGVPVKL
ncbi:TolC family protein [Chitinophaga sp. SYP-B3965]|uniref:TolC family protein n=1 Tax=Chitinophaga sp. SYP-B3965 TaxID=2663120 RepID=UPI0012995FE5|nr:TolC family protein [Chitinophaga sp. SYP-B3965]MRG46123.1 TolC family protein [Chitinophaga sp. SYP-B3965]